jgi:hypothetical protein
MTSPPPDATATDQFGATPYRTDKVAFEKTALVLPMAGYGQITIEGEWNNYTATHDKLQHELVEVEKAEMQLHGGQLVHMNAHPAHPTGSDAIVRTPLDTTHHHRRFGHEQHTAVGALHQTGLDRQVRPGIDLEPHMRRFGHEQNTAVGALHQTGLDRQVRPGIDIEPHMRRFGHEQHTAVGALHQTGLDRPVRPGIDLEPHMRRFGHEQHTAVGPIRQTGHDAIARTAQLDLDAHNQRFGHELPTAVGPIQQTGLDAVSRTELHIDAHLGRFGHEQHIATGPLQQTGLDAKIRPELDIEQHHRRFGHAQTTVGHPTHLDSTFDHTQTPEQDISAYSRERGQVHGTAHPSSQAPHTPAEEGRAARISPLNTSDMSRNMGLAFAYTGAQHSSVDTDRNAMHRTELNASAPACGAHSMTTAATTHPSTDPSGILTHRASYEKNDTDQLLLNTADLSWVAMPHPSGQANAQPAEHSRRRTPDSLEARQLPADPGNSASHTTSVAARDAAKKRPLPALHRQNSTADQAGFSKLPVIYETRRRVAMTSEMQPQPPASEFPMEIANRQLPEN